MNKGLKQDLGTCVRLIIGNVDIIVSSKANQTMDNQIFVLHVIDISDYKIIGLKSSQHFKAYFEDISKNIISLNPPGIHTSDLSVINFKNIKRPVFPLDILESD